MSIGSAQRIIEAAYGFIHSARTQTRDAPSPRTKQAGSSGTTQTGKKKAWGDRLEGIDEDPNDMGGTIMGGSSEEEEGQLESGKKASKANEASSPQRGRTEE